MRVEQNVAMITVLVDGEPAPTRAIGELPAPARPTGRTYKRRNRVGLALAVVGLVLAVVTVLGALAGVQ